MENPLIEFIKEELEHYTEEEGIILTKAQEEKVTQAMITAIRRQVEGQLEEAIENELN